MAAPSKYKRLIVNAALATLAAFAGAFAASSDWLPETWVAVPAVAAAYGALRVGAGLVAAELGKPISVDEPPPGGPDPDLGGE